MMAMMTCTLITSCSDFLEEENKSNLTDSSQWENAQNSDIYLNNLYGEMNRPHNRSETMDYYSDDYNISHYYTASNWRQGICQVPGGSASGDWNGTHGPTEGYDWNNLYKKIRACNTYIIKMTEFKKNFDEAFFNQRIDEARFLRAFFYFTAFRHYGGLPIITKVLDRTTMSEEELLVPRSTAEETYKFISDELSSIISNGHLQVKYNAGKADAGRATIGAALGYKAVLDLFAASPLMNTGSPYLPDAGKFVHFGSADPGRWAKAAATCKQFIDTYGNADYKLFNDLERLWRESNEYNSEVIWDIQCVGNSPRSNNIDTYGGVPYIHGAYMNWGNYNPTQELVDDFLMANGKKITDKDSGYDPQDPYKDREPRFYQFIVFDGAELKFEWMAEPDVIYTRIDKVNPSKNEIDLAGKNDQGDSGYLQKKSMGRDAVPGSGMNGENQVMLRYAEILLSYAEAQNEAAGPDASVYDAINQIRKRSGVPELKAGLSKDEMREEIYRERRIELCFERVRYFDNKRLLKQEDRMGVPRHNMVITNTSPADNTGKWVYSVEPEVKWKAAFNARQYMTPIPQSAIDQNHKIKQNPGYE